MSDLHVRQISSYLERTYSALIDLSDVSTVDNQAREKRFLTRALSAFALQHLAEVDPSEAAEALTDSFDDNGIDAAYYHKSDRFLFLVQSKWMSRGVGGIKVGDVQNFAQGFRDLANDRFERFNPAMQKRRDELLRALLDASTKIVLVLVYTSQQALSKHCSRIFADLIEEVNEPTPLLSLQVLRQSDLHTAVSQGIAGAPVNAQIALSGWGQVREPYGALYGQIAASDVAALWEANFPRILTPNIRMYLGQTDVNAGLARTLRESPENFWYFNNGITALCASYRKAPIGGDTREYGIFDCIDMRIVNGAQTAGAIARTHEVDPSAVKNARVPFRVISLEGCPEGFDRDVTQNTNTQNRVESRDFVALDPDQQRIASELEIEGVAYVYKSGHSVAQGREGFDLVEATVAQACADPDLQYAVQAKREIGRLWQDINRAPYKRLFGSHVAGPEVWAKVQYLASSRIAARRTGKRRVRPEKIARNSW